MSLFYENELRWMKNKDYADLDSKMRMVQNKYYKKNKDSRYIDQDIRFYMNAILENQYIKIVTAIKNNKKKNYMRSRPLHEGYYVERMFVDMIEQKMALKESIIAAAFHPKRLQHVLDTFGTIEAWEATVGA